MRQRRQAQFADAVCVNFNNAGCLQVSQAISAASDSPMIAAGTDAPFGKASDSTYDPSLPLLHHHAQPEVRKQRNFRRGSRPRSAKHRNAPRHESRLNLSPDPDVPAQQVTFCFCVSCILNHGK